MSAPIENSNATVQTEPTVEEKQEAKVEVKASQLTPAPLPTNSPWKTVAGGTPASFGGSSGKWPSTQEAVEQLERRERQGPAPVIKATGKEKWVPIKASIVVSGFKKPNSNANGGQSNKKQPAKKNKKNTTGNRTKKQQSNKQEKSESSTVVVGSVTADGESSKAEAQEHDASDEQNRNGTSGIPKRSSSQSHQRKSSHNQNNYVPRRRYQNNGGNHENGSFKPYQQYVMFQHKSNYVPFRQSQVNHQYNSSNNRQRFYQRGPQSQTTFYSPQPPHPFIAVNNIARQIEYYFSTENLVKDTYLRSHFTEDGYAPLALISKFYRIVNMSLGGDEYLIMGALREIVANANASVDVAEVEEEVESALERYYIRSKEWEKWVAANVQENIEVPKSVAFKSNLDQRRLDQFQVDPLVFEPPQNKIQNQSHQKEAFGDDQESHEDQNEDDIPIGDSVPEKVAESAA
ncbi:LAFE_0G01178g1_1 [Lachancea fermentati]|uniref:LAFE_0G01178g1_1 n=1 Tax=Lachancea fermentati TaxID=4955 RepID=A0A1G4MGK6_LACFM|nr:LAFE_0G01178g1_1 [Lachancea fermentati]